MTPRAAAYCLCNFFSGKFGDEMMSLCGVATKKNPFVCEAPSSFPELAGNAPEHEDFQARTMWSLSNAFTSALKELDPIPQFKVTAKLASYLERVSAA